MRDSQKFIIMFAVSMALVVAGVVLLMADMIGIGVFGAIMILSIAMILASVFLFKGTKADLTDDALILSAPFVDARIPYSSIDSVSCTEGMDFGIRTFGYGGWRYGSGDFTNKVLGGYTRAASSAVPLVIVIIAGKKKYVINLKTIEETRELLGTLESKVSPERMRDMPPMTDGERRAVADTRQSSS